MFVLHGLWEQAENGKLHLMIESSDLWFEMNRSKTATEKATNEKLNELFHPFIITDLDVIKAQLLESFNFVKTEFISKLEPDYLIVRLPSDSKLKLPQASPQLKIEIESVLASDKGKNKVDQKKNKLIEVDKMLNWKIKTWTLEPATALGFLLALTTDTNYADKLLSSNNVVLGDSVHFWTEVSKFTLELVARQRFLPSYKIKKDRSEFNSIWKAFLADSAGKPDPRLEILAKAMPPNCRAIVRKDVDGPISETDQKPSTSPTNLIIDFLNQTLDGFVRQEIDKVSFLPKSLATNSARFINNTATLPERWISSLVSKKISSWPITTQKIEAVKKFESELGPWLGQINYQRRLTDKGGISTPFRTCFKLEQPSNQIKGMINADHISVDKKENSGFLDNSPEAEEWALSFYLQATDDRSLLVPAQEVWQERSNSLTFLKYQFENPQERLLADLAVASRLYPPIENSLHTARPFEIHIKTEQAYNFLRQAAPLLEQSGFGVLLPNWWQQQKKERALRLGIKLKLKPNQNKDTMTGGLLGLDGIVAYDWQVAIGEQSLSPQEFEKLARLKVPLVKVRGQWVELKNEDIEAAISFFEKQHSAGQMAFGEALRIGLGSGEIERQTTGLPVVEVSGEGWVGELWDKLTNSNTKIEAIEQPASFKGTLRPYQLQGLAWLAFLKNSGMGACLADDMGLGKTAQLISLLVYNKNGKSSDQNNQTNTIHWEQTNAKKPVLVICPMSVVGNWQRELRRFAPDLKVMVHHGAGRLEGEDFNEAFTDFDVIITTYNLVQRDSDLLSTYSWDGLVLDEAQNIKNNSSKQAQAVRRLKANYKVALTGTPVENRLSELWSIMDFLNPGYLGSASSFRNSFAAPIEKYRDVEKSEKLKHLIQPFILRRLKTDKTIIQDLPDKIEMRDFCNLTQEQATLYEAVVKEMLEKIEGVDEKVNDPGKNSGGIERKGLVLSTLLRLKQVCNHPAQYTGDTNTRELSNRSGKLERLREMLEEVLAENNKALIFTQFAEMGTMLQRYLQEIFGFEVLYLYGGTTKIQRDLMVERFQKEGRGSPQLFVLSLKAGGVGLNLTAANHVFHFDRWWNPATENQATDRAYRIGQYKNVQVHKFVCAGTLEERIDEMIEQKRGLAASIVGANSGESWLTEMDTGQLRELFRLSRETALG